MTPARLLLARCWTAFKRRNSRDQQHCNVAPVISGLLSFYLTYFFDNHRAKVRISEWLPFGDKDHRIDVLQRVILVVRKPDLTQLRRLKPSLGILDRRRVICLERI